MPLILALLLLAPQDDARALIEKLRTGTLEERDDATRRLKELGKAAAPELEKAAKDPDAEVAGRARHLLARLQLADTLSPALQKAFPGIADKLGFGGDAAWTHALIEAEKLSHPKSRIPVLKRADLEALGARAIRGADTVELKCEVAEAAVRRRLASAAPEILKFFDDGDEDLWELAIVAAQQHPSPEGVRRLRDLTRHESSDIRQSAMEALEHLKIREAAPDAVRLAGDADAFVRGAAASALGSLRGKEAVGDLVRLLKDREAHVRESAVEGLLVVYAKEEASKIAPLLRDPDKNVRQAAAEAVGYMDHRESIPRLTALLKDEGRVRRAALSALHVLKAREAVPEVLKLLENPGDNTPYVLWEMLMDLAPRETKERALSLLKHAKPEVRSSAAYLVGRLGDASAGPEIIKLLKDEGEGVRSNAAWAAGRLGIREAIPELMKLLDTPGERSREVFMALVDLDVKEAVPKFIECLKEETSPWPATALGRMKAKEAVPALAANLAGSVDVIKHAAIDALVKIEGKDAVPRILPLLEQEADGVSVNAIRALADLEAWDQAPVVARLLEDRETEVRVTAAWFLARAGSRDGVTVLIEEEEWEEGWLLNAVRAPDAWKRIQKTKVKGKRSGTPLEIVRGMAKEAGVEVEVEESPVGDSERWLERDCWGTDLEEPTPVLDAIWGELPTEYEMILEPGRIRLVPLESARAFWRAWWKAGGPMVK